MVRKSPEQQRRRRLERRQAIKENAQQQAQSGITRRKLLLALLGTGITAPIAGKIIHSYLTAPYPDVNLLPEKERTKRFLEIAKAIEEAELGKVQWVHPDSGPSNPIFIRSYTHELPDDTFAGENHIEHVSREFQTGLLAYQQGLRRFATEGSPSDHELTPLTILTTKPGFTDTKVSAMMFPEGSVDESGNDFATKQLQENPNYGRVDKERSISILSMPENIESMIRARSGNGGFSFGTALATALPDDAVVIGIEDPAKQKLLFEKFRESQTDFEASTELRAKLVADFNDDKPISLSFRINQETNIVESVDLGNDVVIPMDVLLRVLQDMKRRGQFRGPVEQFHADRERYLTENVDCDMAFFGTDHLHNFAKLQNPSRSLGIVWPQKEYYSETSDNFWAKTAEELLNFIVKDAGFDVRVVEE